MNNQSPLDALLTLDTKMRDYGFAWQQHELIIEQIHNELIEVTQAIAQKESHERIQEEIGDLIHATLSLAIFLHYDIDQTLLKTTQKLAHRFEKLQNIAQQQGYSNLKEQSHTTLIHLWKKAKK